MATNTFRRNEIKYSVTSEQYIDICKKIPKYMDYDRYCADGKSYMIYNLYFDTFDNEIIRRSLAKPYFKEKLRLRSYKLPTFKDDTVFLELKRKIGGIVAKRRASMSYDEAIKFIETKIPPRADNYFDEQVNSELLDFLNRYDVSSKVYISYERLAFFSKNDSTFRVSFDKNILTRRTNVNLIDSDYGAELLTNGNYLMEVKCAGAIPLWLANILSEMKIYKTNFSKYGTEYSIFFNSNEKYISALEKIIC